MSEGKLVICISNEIGAPIYNSKIEIINEDGRQITRTNFCGLARLKIKHGSYNLIISANEYISRRFRVKFSEQCSFLDLSLKTIGTKVCGYVDRNQTDVNVKLLYEINQGTYVSVIETKPNVEGFYEFKNLPRGNYKVEAEE